MTTTIKCELAGQSKTVVPKVQIESDDMSGEEILQKLNELYSKAETIAVTYAMNRMK